MYFFLLSRGIFVPYMCPIKKVFHNFFEKGIVELWKNKNHQSASPTMYSVKKFIININMPLTP